MNWALCLALKLLLNFEVTEAELSTSVAVNIQAFFWYMTPYGPLDIFKCFCWNCCLYLQGS
jgi:hypothetical protein